MNKVGRSGEWYIFETGNRYLVVKQLNGKHKYFGGFHSLEEAKEHRDYCVEHGWSEDCVKRKRRNRRLTDELHIQEVGDTGKYRVVKLVDGKYVYFGTFDTLDDARRHRDYCISKGWSSDCRVLTRKKHNLPSYITRSGGGFLLQKRSKVHNYRQWFKCLEDAVYERELLLKVDWDEERLWELDECEGTL